MAEAFFAELRKKLIDQIRPVWGPDSIDARDILSRVAREAVKRCYERCAREGIGPDGQKYTDLSACYRACAQKIKEEYFKLWRGRGAA